MASLSAVFDKDNDFWEEYLKGRPTPPDNLFELILDYHKQHGGEFGTVHNCGAGVGVHTDRIGSQFENVLISDIAEQNIQIAKEKMAGVPKLTLQAAKTEDASWVKPESVDLFFAANVLHLTNVEKSLEAVNQQLKPGGTFAATIFAIPVLKDPKFQAAWMNVWQNGRKKNPYVPQDEAQRANFLKGVGVAASFYDAIPLSEDIFSPAARRYKLNCPEDKDWWFNYLIGQGLKDTIPRINEIGPHDVVIEEQQAGWELKTNLQGLKENTASFPIWGDGAEFEVVWKELEAVVGDSVIEGVWPASVLLATKK